VKHAVRDTPVSCSICASPDTRIAFFLKDHAVSGETFHLRDCKRCGFRFTYPLPEPDVISDYYRSETYISHSDTRKGIINAAYHVARNFMLRRKIRWVSSFSPGKTLLDVGCGTGYFLNTAQKQGYIAQGVEVDAGARQFAKEKFGLQVDEAEAFLSEHFQKSFDWITLWHVLEHLHNPDRYLAKIKACLEENGLLLIAVPNFSSLDAAHYGDYWAGYDVPRHLWHFHPIMLVQWVTSQGFRLRTKKSMFLDAFYVSLLSEKYLKRGLIGLFSGLLIGFLSSLNGLIFRDKSSSIIYVFGKA